MTKENRSLNISKAYTYWAYYMKLESGDQTIRRVLSFSGPLEVNNWLEICREGLWLTQTEMGERLGMSRETYRKMEESEKKGSLKLSKLQRAAEAMNCELVYFVRPKQRKTFSAILWDQLEAAAVEEYQKRFRQGEIKPVVLARTAVRLLKKKKVRAQRKWRRIFGPEKFA
jgi:XRE family transcriptional regulator, regulator of sulfur utilization